MTKYNYNNNISDSKYHSLINYSDSDTPKLSNSESESESKSESESESNSESKSESDSESKSGSDSESESESDLESDIDNVKSNDLLKIMKINYSYPDHADPHFQSKIYKKREFYYHKIPAREILTEYADIKKFRDMSCGGTFRLRSQQSLLSNFINPETPFRGILMYHGVGTGKCVHPDSLVELIGEVHNQGLDKKSIADLWNNNYNDNNIIIDNEGGEWLDVSMNSSLNVKAYNTFSKSLIPRPISKIYRERLIGDLIKITLSDNRTIICSKNHMFYKLGVGWTNILNVFDKILVNDESYVLDYVYIGNIEYIRYSGFIYDLEVANIHSYVVNGIVTHNTCSAIAIAENFKDQVKKYGTKIHILVSGPLIKENWKDELIKCTKETYLKDISNGTGIINEYERNKQITQAKSMTQQYYKIMSYRSFYKKVLGQKISDKRVTQNKLKKIYRKNADGDFERDVSIDKLESLDNTLLIIDEAHNITDNEYGNAVQTIIEKSHNLKVIILTATPMINFADEIVQLLNYIRPQDDPVYRDMIFTNEKNHLMTFKPGGKEYLSKMASGYVSHFRGLNPLTFAEGVDIGEIPDDLLFTKLYRCNMLKFQTDTYLNILKNLDDSLDRRSQAVSNFCFVGLNNSKNELQGYFGKEGMDIIRSQLKSNKSLLQKMINDKFFDGKLDNNEVIKESDKNKSITGLILKKENVKFFSIKFYTALSNLENLVVGKNGPGTAFLYFNLVKVGIDLFTEVLLINGYLEYNESGSYNISNNTIDALTGLTYKDFKEQYKNEKFYPATFITMTGKNEDAADQIPEVKKKILDSVFNNISNKDGRNIKFILGSKVMNEGITLENVAEVHIMDVYYNLGKIHQVIGRALRECKHYKIINDDNRYPKVNIYRYVVSLEDSKELTTEEQMYQKAEQKYILVKETERILKEVAFDCPLEYHANIFPEEVKKYKNCVSVKELIDMTPEQKRNALICPTQCDLTDCSFKCFDSKLNLKYYDKNKSLYSKITKDNLDYSTFTNVLARNEINFAKDKIKELYKFRYVYTLEECVSKIKRSYIGEKKDLFDDFFVYKALDELIPISENDFNNFGDTIYDKFNVPGYLIYRDKFYIFQPFEENEDVPMYYRSTFHSELYNNISLYNYLKSTDILKIINSTSKNDIQNKIKSKTDNKNVYNFTDIIQYYESKPEYEYVGIIDKTSIKKSASYDVIPDTFKLRSKREKILKKKRGTGIPTLTGAVCETSQKKSDLMKLAKILNIEVDKKSDDDGNSRVSVCKLIRYRLLYLEKYSTYKDKNKFTFMIIPSNHPKYPFPFNLEDRIEYIKENISSKTQLDLDFNIEKSNQGIFENKRSKDLVKYTINITNSSELEKFEKVLTSSGFQLINKKQWTIVIE